MCSGIVLDPYLSIFHLIPAQDQNTKRQHLMLLSLHIVLSQCSIAKLRKIRRLQEDMYPMMAIFLRAKTLQSCHKLSMCTHSSLPQIIY